MEYAPSNTQMRAQTSEPSAKASGKHRATSAQGHGPASVYPLNEDIRIENVTINTVQENAHTKDERLPNTDPRSRSKYPLPIAVRECQDPNCVNVDSHSVGAYCWICGGIEMPWGVKLPRTRGEDDRVISRGASGSILEGIAVTNPYEVTIVAVMASLEGAVLSSLPFLLDLHFTDSQRYTAACRIYGTLRTLCSLLSPNSMLIYFSADIQASIERGIKDHPVRQHHKIFGYSRKFGVTELRKFLSKGSLPPAWWEIMSDALRDPDLTKEAYMKYVWGRVNYYLQIHGYCTVAPCTEGSDTRFERLTTPRVAAFQYTSNALSNDEVQLEECVSKEKETQAQLEALSINNNDSTKRDRGLANKKMQSIISDLPKGHPSQHASVMTETQQLPVVKVKEPLRKGKTRNRQRNSPAKRQKRMGSRSGSERDDAGRNIGDEEQDELNKLQSQYLPPSPGTNKCFKIDKSKDRPQADPKSGNTRATSEAATKSVISDVKKIKYPELVAARKVPQPAIGNKSKRQRMDSPEKRTALPNDAMRPPGSTRWGASTYAGESSHRRDVHHTRGSERPRGFEGSRAPDFPGTPEYLSERRVYYDRAPDRSGRRRGHGDRYVGDHDNPNDQNEEGKSHQPRKRENRHAWPPRYGR